MLMRYPGFFGRVVFHALALNLRYTRVTLRGKSIQQINSIPTFHKPSHPVKASDARSGREWGGLGEREERGERRERDSTFVIIFPSCCKKKSSSVPWNLLTPVTSVNLVLASRRVSHLRLLAGGDYQCCCATMLRYSEQSLHIHSRFSSQHNTASERC